MLDKQRAYRKAERFNTFADGVVIISMTLLILNVELPDSLGNLDGAALLSALVAIWPKYFGYILSFLVIAQYWLGYTAKFGEMRFVDPGFVRLTILFLLAIGFVPFVTALVSEHAGFVAISIYAASMMTISALLVLMLFHAHRKGLIEPAIPRSEIWWEAAPWLKIIGVFGVSIIVALQHIDAAKFVWLLLAAPDYRPGKRQTLS